MTSEQLIFKCWRAAPTYISVGITLCQKVQIWRQQLFPSMMAAAGMTLELYTMLTMTLWYITKKNYRTRCNISDSNVATLILKKVTEDERAIFQCKLSTLSNSWTYSILVNFTSKCQFGDIHLITSDALCKTPVLNHSRYFLLFNLPTNPNCVSLIKMSGFGIRTSPLYSICPKIYYYHDPTFKPSVELWKDLLFLIFSQDPL